MDLRSFKPVAFLIVLVLLVGAMVLVPIPKGHPAITTFWTGAAGDGKWETAGNWDNGVPTSAALAVILPGTFVVTISTAQSAEDLMVGMGDTVTCESTCNLTLTQPLGLNNVGTFTNFGTVTSDGLGNAGTFTNFGTVTTSVPFVNIGTFTNRCHGTVNITPTAGTGTFTTDPTCPASGPVGGFMEPANKLAVFAPYLALLGVMAVVVIAVRPWRREN